MNIANALKKKSNNQPMKSYLWRVVFPDIFSGLSLFAGTSGESSGWEQLATVIHNAEVENEIIRDVPTRITNLTIPNYTLGLQRNNYGNTYWQAPTQLEINNMTMEIMDFEDTYTIAYLESWKSLIIHNASGKQGNSPAYTFSPPAYYKRPIIVYYLSNSREDLLRFEYHGCFPSTIDDRSSDYESSDFVKYNVTFAVDGMKFNRIKTSDTESIKLAKKELQLDTGFTYSRMQVGNAVEDFLRSITYD